jgi:endonuclease/exonuclease/phosphatase family metal-dependent hydrolase
MVCAGFGCASPSGLHRAPALPHRPSIISIGALCPQAATDVAPLAHIAPWAGVDHDYVARGASAPAEYPRSSEGDIANRLSVLTFNMWHKDKPHELQAMAERLHSDLAELPDFIMLQEVMFNRSRPKDDPRDSTAAVLADQLGYHCYGTKRTSDREGIAIISRYPFEYYGERHLEAQTSPLLLGFRRVSVMGEFLVPGAGRVRIVNVHFTNWGFEAHVRAKQLQETLVWMAQREQEVPADITFLGGDFNMRPTWDEMQLITDAQFDPLLQLQSFNDDKLPTKGSPGNPRHRIDYIFVCAPNAGRQLALIQERSLWAKGMEPLDGSRTIKLSDHVPLLHEYRVIQPPALASVPVVP